jgi:hypothetical protein
MSTKISGKAILNGVDESSQVRGNFGNFSFINGLDKRRLNLYYSVMLTH